MATIQRGTGAKFETNDSDGNIGKYPVTSKPRIVYGFYGREWIVGRGRVGALIASNYRNFQEEITILPPFNRRMEMTRPNLKAAEFMPHVFGASYSNVTLIMPINGNASENPSIIQISIG